MTNKVMYKTVAARCGLAATTDETFEAEQLTYEHFAKAADIMDAEGKVSGAYKVSVASPYARDGVCGVCAVGALGLAVGLEPEPEGVKHIIDWVDVIDYSKIVRDFAGFIGSKFEGASAIFDWSDENDKETVTKAFREFAAKGQCS